MLGLRISSALCATILAAFMPQTVTAQLGEQREPRRLDVMIGNSDEYAESKVSLRALEHPVGISSQDHAKVTSILSTTKEMINTANALIEDEKTFQEGTEMMKEANAMFREATGHIAQRMLLGDEDHMVRRKYSEHDIQQAKESEERALDVARNIFEVSVSFTECIELFLQDCLEKINGSLGDLGLASIEIIVNEKRNVNQVGYNKVVIITNNMADRVQGQAGDGKVTYPFLWEDPVNGFRTLGVDGKWNCVYSTPEECCQTIKDSAPTPDTKGNYVECHIFVPFGGVGKPKRNDRVFIKLSPDGRVHEAPIIQ